MNSIKPSVLSAYCLGFSAAKVLFHVLGFRETLDTHDISVSIGH